MDTKILFAGLFILASIAGTAQSNIVVYHTTGTVLILNNGSTTPAERGKSIGKTASLQVKANSSCMLIDSLGKSVQVSKFGTYNYSTLLQMLKNAGKENVAGEFYAYIYQNLKKEKKSDAMRVGAIVQRGHPLMRAPLDSIIITSDKINFEWRRVSDKLTMQLVIRNHNADILFDTNIKKTTTYNNNVNGWLLEPRTGYEWKVDESGTTQPSEKYFNFIVADKQDREKIKKQQKAISDSKMPADVKWKMQKDLYEFWEDKYSYRTNE